MTTKECSDCTKSQGRNGHLERLLRSAGIKVMAFANMKPKPTEYKGSPDVFAPDTIPDLIDDVLELIRADVKQVRTRAETGDRAMIAKSRETANLHSAIREANSTADELRGELSAAQIDVEKSRLVVGGLQDENDRLRRKLSLIEDELNETTDNYLASETVVHSLENRLREYASRMERDGDV